MRLGLMITTALVGIGLTAGAVADMQRNASDILGATVQNPVGEEIGTVEDLIVHSEDEILAAILSVGGFLGIGDKLIAVPYGELEFHSDEMLVYPSTRESLEELPGYQGGPVDAALTRAENAIDNALAETKDFTADMKAKYEDEMQETVAAWEMRMAELERGGKETADETREKLEATWVDVKNEWARLQDASGEAWEDAKGAMDDGMSRLEAAWNELTSES